jgi:hypothetical protein
MDVATIICIVLCVIWLMTAIGSIVLYHRCDFFTSCNDDLLSIIVYYIISILFGPIFFVGIVIPCISDWQENENSTFWKQERKGKL